METRLSVERSYQIANALLFNDNIIVSAVNHAGEIWVLWNNHEVNLAQIQVSNRGIHAIASLTGSDPFVLSAVYNYPQTHLQGQVWNELITLSQAHSERWLVIGDFNNILSENEKKGGRKPLLSKINSFKNCLYTCGLMDLGFSGHPFTWNNRRFGKDFICERLDRAVANIEWINTFPHAKLYHLTSSTSDHSPILLDTHDESQPPRKLFRYEIAWSLDNSFINVIRDCWQPPNNQSNTPSFYNTYKTFKSKVTWWKKHIYGNLDRKIDALNHNLEQLTNSLDLNYNIETHWKLDKIRIEHQKLLKQKEIYWKQRSRIKWLKEGDSNTKFFHAFATNRKRRNLIQSLKTTDHTWIYKPNDINNFLTSWFRNFYCSSGNHSFSFDSLNCFQIPDSTHQNLNHCPNTEEIWKALNKIGPDKAPGPDGLNAHFFHTYWHFLAPYVNNMIQEFFNTNQLKEPINSTRIILIPKNTNPYLVNHFRPISLCNVTYKIISNIIVSRIRPLMNNIISPYQNAFVPTRLISDNLSLAHELLHTMKSKKSKTYYMAFKIDLEKAYDKLEWNFILNALTKLNFPQKLIGWIMTCIQSVSYSLLINGHISDTWYPQRGIRQGDPLSPYLFIICLNLLILKFIEGHNSNLFDGLQINKNTPPIPILCFADDCIIFCKATEKSINFIHDTLKLFAKEAGLKICWNKSKAYFSKNTPNHKIRDICNKLEIQAGNVGEKYLGLPMIINRITKESFYDIITKAQSKITTWYNKYLSYAGRSILVNHVLTTLPLYTMNTHKIPEITLNKINSISKHFLWNASAQTNKKSPINWDYICNPKYLGGLGFRNLHILNNAFLLKLAWRLLTDTKSLWAKTIKGKYFSNTNILNAPKPKTYHSGSWKNIYKLSKYLKDCQFWIVGNGKKINFWYDKWIDNFTINDYVSDIPLHLKSLKVANIINKNTKSWNLSVIAPYCPDFIIRKIMAIHIPHTRQKDDFRWAFTKQGKFTIKSAYLWLLNKNIPIIQPTLPWNCIWKLKICPRIKFFTWQLIQNCLPNSVILKQKKILDSNFCPLCKSQPETNHHLFLECPLFDQIRRKLPNLQNYGKNFINIFYHFAKQPETCHMIATLFWLMWKARNNYIFKNIPINNNIIWVQKNIYLTPQNLATKKLNKINLQWKPPPHGWYILNIDGAVPRNPGNAGIGGIIRDHEGKLVAAFAKNIGYTTNNKAEVWAFKFGLKLAADLELSHLIIETDSTFLLNCLSRLENLHSSLVTILMDAQQIITKFEQVEIRFCYRERNGAADFLAKKGSTLNLDEASFFDQNDCCLDELMSKDLSFVFVRCISNSCNRSIILK